MKTNYIKTNILLIIMCLLGFTAIQAQVRGSGNILTEERNVGSFTGIKNSSSADIFIQTGESNTIKVVADDNILKYISTTVQNGILVIDTKENIWNAKKMEVYVSINKLTSLVLNGSGNLSCPGPISGNNVSVQMQGSGDLVANFDAKSLDLAITGSGNADVSGIRGDMKISISGSGDVKASNLQLDNCSASINGSGDMNLSGSAVNLTIKIFGSGDINAYNLKAVSAKVSSAGSGDIVVHAVEKLQANLNGSGDLTYTGSPSIVDADVSGSGEIYKK